MACYYPMQALRLPNVFTKNNKSVITFVSREKYSKLKSQMGNSPDLLSGLPCGRCVGCRLERSRQWAIRMMHEAQLHDDNIFLTLTFDQEHLLKRKNPISLDKREFQLFLKRLRKTTNNKIRYFMCGEYGKKFGRPHYHAIIFNYKPNDLKLEKIENGKRYYSSASIRKLWPDGNNIITDVSFDTCAYVARYIMKKHLGKGAWMRYLTDFNPQTGEFTGHRIPEYTTMSRRSGIGKAWLDKYLRDVYPKDRVFVRGKGFQRPPKYYDSQYEIIDPSDYSRIKQARINASLDAESDNTPERLHAKQVVKLAQISVLNRNKVE